MPAIWGDGYDCYAAPADATAGYWDSGTVGFTLVAGRFSGSQAIQNAGNTAWLVKTTTGTTDNNHHISCAFQQTAAISGTTLGMYFQLSDGATNQVCVVFRSDGAILLTSATPAGTVLATYTGAVTAASTWYQFEFEVVISNTVGRFRVRKLGNTSDDFDSGATLNTRPGANAQASKLTVGQNATVTSHVMDDLLWRSDTTAVSFSGDIRCFTRRPASDAAVQWSSSTAGVLPTITLPSNTTAVGSGSVHTFVPFTPTSSGTVATITFPGPSSVYSGNIKCSIFASSAVTPGVVLGSATTLNTLPSGVSSTFTFGTPVAVVAGTQYWVGFATDTATATIFSAVTGANGGRQMTGTSYAAFPVTNPTVASGVAYVCTVNVTLTANPNAAMVQDTTQDAATTYNYSNTVGQSDLYGISAISSTPASIVAVTTRAYLQKSDAGTRNTSVQLKSGSTTVSSASAALGTTWGWQSRTDTTDPATGAAWTAVGVNNATIGVIVTV